MTNPAEPTVIGLPEVDGEHNVQFQLLGAVESALAGGNRDAAAELMQQLGDFTESHFASEQVLMRLHSYPGYWSHEREHGQLLADLQRLAEGIASADAAGLPEKAEGIRRWLVSHINSSDKAFVTFMRETPAPVYAKPGE